MPFRRVPLLATCLRSAEPPGVGSGDSVRSRRQVARTRHAALTHHAPYGTPRLVDEPIGGAPCCTGRTPCCTVLQSRGSPPSSRGCRDSAEVERADVAPVAQHRRTRQELTCALAMPGGTTSFAQVLECLDDDFRRQRTLPSRHRLLIGLTKLSRIRRSADERCPAMAAIAACLHGCVC